MLTHPDTGEKVWFNHVAFFHMSTLDADLRKMLLKNYGIEGMPNNTCFGDGAPIEDEVIAHIREAYEQEMVALPWERGDLMVVDNLLAAHARRPFSGTRRILVAMSFSAAPRGMASMTAPQTGLAIDEIRADLGRKLPTYMIPSEFLELDELPSSAAGKVNRNRLAEMPGRRIGGSRSARSPAVGHLRCAARLRRGWAAAGGNPFAMPWYATRPLETPARLRADDVWQLVAAGLGARGRSAVAVREEAVTARVEDAPGDPGAPERQESLPEARVPAMQEQD